MREHRCPQCKVTKPIDDEHWYFAKKGDGRRRDSMCKECRKEYRKEHKNLYAKEYYSSNKERYKEHNRRWSENNIERKLWYSCKASAKRRGLEFTIEPSDIVIPDYCPIFGIPIDKTYGGLDVQSTWGSRPNRPSVDRKDSSKGYTKDNIQIISSRANALKSDATPEELIMLGEFGKKMKGEVPSISSMSTSRLC